MKLVRTRVWRPQLAEWAKVQRGRPYVWGETDCAALAREALGILFGEDPTTAWLPTWTTEREALRVLREVGGVAGALARLGGTAQALSRLQSGSIILQAGEDNHPARLAVYVEPIVVRSAPEEGVQWITRQNLDRAQTMCYNLWEVDVG